MNDLYEEQYRWESYWLAVASRQLQHQRLLYPSVSSPLDGSTRRCPRRIPTTHSRHRSCDQYDDVFVSKPTTNRTNQTRRTAPNRHCLPTPDLDTMMSSKSDRTMNVQQHRSSVESTESCSKLVANNRQTGTPIQVRRKPVPPALPQPPQEPTRKIKRRDEGWKVADRARYDHLVLHSPLSATSNPSSRSSLDNTVYFFRSPASEAVSSATSESSSSKTRISHTRSSDAVPSKDGELTRTRSRSLSNNLEQQKQQSKALERPRRRSTPKLRRVVSAQPYVNREGLTNEEQTQEDEDESAHEPESPTAQQPTSFWNPRSGNDMAPMRRTFSRKLRCWLQPQRTKIEGTAKVKYAAERAWSVDRPRTPVLEEHTAVMRNPFLILSHTFDVADTVGSAFSETDFEQIDMYAANVKQRGPMLTPQVLAQKFLVRPHRRDLHKIRSIFIWLIQNIVIECETGSTQPSFCYDTQDLRPEDVEDLAEQVLSCRSCSSSIGIASLFYEMAVAAGFEEARIVFGYLRAAKDTFDSAVLSDGSITNNHAWCAVKVDGEYRFVDCWLASPYQPQNDNKMEPHWFLAKPSDLIYTHFPLNRTDQFLEPPISAGTFFSLPHVLTPFFWHKMQVIDFSAGTLELVDDQVCHLSIRVDSDIACYAEVEARSNSGSIVQRGLAQCQSMQINGKTETVCKVKAVLPPNHVMGWLKIYAGPRVHPRQQHHHHHHQDKINPSHYPLALYFQLTHTGESRSFEFVQLHTNHYDFYVQEPQCYHLYPLQTYNFRVHGGSSVHHKLAIRSPSGRLYKLMYYPQDYTYDGSVTVSEVGVWSLICLLHHAGGWSVVASWECCA